LSGRHLVTGFLPGQTNRGNLSLELLGRGLGIGKG
jgi:hypothetical protein